jgi:hypothetical protein
MIPLYSQYIFSLTSVVVKNKDQYISGEEIHSLHLPTSSSTVYQRCAQNFGIKVLTIFHLIYEY